MKLLSQVRASMYSQTVQMHSEAGSITRCLHSTVLYNIKLFDNDKLTELLTNECSDTDKLLCDYIATHTLTSFIIMIIIKAG